MSRSAVEEYRYPALQILSDWRARKISKPHANLPAKFTASSLTYIRTAACFAAGKANCGYWAKRKGVLLPEPDDPNFPEGHCLSASILDESDELDDPCADINACETCQSPGVTMEQMSAALFGKRATDPSAHAASRTKDARDDELKKRKSELRRLMRGAVPLSSRDFCWAVANAYAQGWLDEMQAINMVLSAMRLKSVSLTLKERLKVFRRKPECPVDAENLLKGAVSEERKLWDDFFKAALASANGPGWDPGLREEMLDALLE